ncbi:hypothetical protein A2331_00560 [Candidatus Falkowbacteria bacterium RIFOXYB2_FULL_34_18]|uniref:Uncharacterized protein n=1 Tax=Candidatus Falkowbacteria bacterium RIFOXYD2_FULL_34_120 TaxID=1798007 RepID=A0A1F5TPD7_9BACT|nr:MAG: hypothetical protein A2331_00560 [Candidatus Falkowbacteria bacterium RIFOXYB2_FULL_34_18]OGF29046.1 MAG: hypothetical protein A2500_01960 [Candidatus Falkowbacteria bacterium RIFOXYC12_FULL_34_55]OGF36079.1 MAG: hypothetical protein A2466_00260 [Candidatus Falkowbacteria bacterium RIFOXYC2_FULL_34_220]OGF38557.1 MAG: hypothetical protein A2515_05220 [Candidatus Falkowbacteria bacterium RIFOXYD12_FULL_34_57]OGF40698.1 MAG: hypothetical protein A2531_05650 [Candidatus Falkowbacteria bact
MSKKIKKQIKKSMPLLIIFSLLWSTMAIGLVFNFDFSFYDLSLNRPEALADVATTTVSVLNASPYFTVGPFEQPFSTNTSPINVGGDITFTAKAQDPELDNYYLLVCGDDTGQANNGGAPSCTGEPFCVSGATGTGASSTCTYTGISDPGGETDVWYAYVCDAHATEAACTLASQGSGDGGSPFYVNHAPTISLVTTSDNNKAPGGTFTVQITATDTDVNLADTIYFDICGTNSWASTTHCAVQLCQATSTIQGGATTTTCQFTDTAPTPDQNYTYFAYIRDWHDFAGTNNGTSTYYTIVNVAPSITSVMLHGGINIEPNIKGAAEVTATTTAVVTDNNGCADLANATSSIYWSNATNLENCTADDNNCYQMTTVECAQTSGSCTGVTDSNAIYICTTTIAFHAVPTDVGTWTATNWLAGLKGIDNNGAFGVGTTTTGVELIAAAALDVDQSGIDYGTMNAGNDTGDNNATTTIVNYGNTPIDTTVQAQDDMKSGSYFILATQQEWSLTNFTWGTGTDLASSSVSIDIDVLINRPTNQTDVTDDLYWGLGLPVTTHSGDYTGTTTFSVVMDMDGNWN